MRVAVLGAGYAGLTVARRLEKSLPHDVEIVVVDESGAHLIQHELHRVVRRPDFAEDITIPLGELLDRAEIRTARVDAVDHEANEVALESGETMAYDFAAVCLGAETNFYDLPGVEEHATPLKRVSDAHAIRDDFLGVIAGSGGSTGSPREAGEVGDGRVFVGGAGLSGIQVAGELAAFAREEGAAERVSVVLLERFDTVAPSFPGNFRRAVRDELAARGVEIRTDTAVAEVTDEEIRTEGGDAHEYDQFVWTGGIRGPDALGGERPAVRQTLRLGDGTFVVGDAARVVDGHGERVPASAQAAVRAARVAAKNLVRLVEHEYDGDGVFEPRLEPFTFDSPGWLVSVGDGAVAQVGPSVVTGRAAHALKTTVGVGYLSSVGALRNAAELMSEEFGGGRD